MIVNRILMGQIKKVVKEIMGSDNNKWELRKMQNEIRTLRGTVAQMKKNSHSKQVLVERNGKYYLEEESG